MVVPAGRRSSSREGIRTGVRYINVEDDQGRTRALFGRRPNVVYPPVHYLPDDTRGWRRPRADLELDWAYGYNGDCIGSLHWISDRELVFPVNGLCVIQDMEGSRQRHFKGHSKVVTCIAFNEELGVCASGQLLGTKKRPFVAIWHTSDCLMRSALVYHESRILAVGFVRQGHLLVTLGGERNMEAAVWSDFLGEGPGERSRLPVAAWKGRLPFVFREPKIAVAAGQVPMYAMCMPKLAPNVAMGLDSNFTHFATYDAGIGDKGGMLKFWSISTEENLDGSIQYALKKSQSIFGKVAPRRILFCSWTLDLRCLVCGDNGFFYIFEGNRAIFARQVCPGPLGFAVEVPGHCFLIGTRASALYFPCLRLPSELVKGDPRGGAKGVGRAGRVVEDSWLGEGLWLRDMLGELAARLQLNTADVRGGYAILGTCDHHLLLVNLEQRRVVKVLQVAHLSETWALCHHPDPSMGLCATGDMTGVLRFWDLTERTTVGRVIDFSANGVWWPPFDALQTGSDGQSKGVTALGFGCERIVTNRPQSRSPSSCDSGPLLAIGHNDGTLRVLTFPALKPLLQRTVSNRRRERISCIRFSPRSAEYGVPLLAIGSWDQHVYLFRVEGLDAPGGNDPAVKQHHVLTGNTASVTHLQFSADGLALLTNSKDGQLLIYNTLTGERQTSLTASRNKVWSDPWECIFGWPVIGVWAANKDLDLTDINAVCSLASLSTERGRNSQSQDDCCGSILACGEDSSLVKLYRFPAIFEEQQFRSYSGHSSAVTAVSFAPLEPASRTSPLLITVGGADRTLLQWRVRVLQPKDSSPASLRNVPWADLQPWKWKQDDPDTAPLVALTKYREDRGKQSIPGADSTVCKQKNMRCSADIAQILSASGPELGGDSRTRLAATAPRPASASRPPPFATHENVNYGPPRLDLSGAVQARRPMSASGRMRP